ncbi:MAG: hypothetical protein FJ404_00815 [Verrucomicrobia bacterium]|nr:hypothetical protein [Verrucomicrobiota bacterium]
MKGAPAQPQPKLPAVFPALVQDRTDSEGLFGAELHPDGRVRFIALTAAVEEKPMLHLGASRSVKQGLPPLPAPGVTATSPRIVRFLLTRSELEMVWSSEAARTYVVQTSNDLVVWRDVGSVSGAGTETRYTTRISTEPGATYFRIQQP